MLPPLTILAPIKAEQAVNDGGLAGRLEVATPLMSSSLCHRSAAERTAAVVLTMPRWGLQISLPGRSGRLAKTSGTFGAKASQITTERHQSDPGATVGEPADPGVTQLREHFSPYLTFRTAWKTRRTEPGGRTCSLVERNSKPTPGQSKNM